MQYISGLYGLNVNCKLDTCGDWHCSALDWKNLSLWDSDKSVFGNYGIELNKTIPEHEEKYNVANHIRSLLDLIAIGNFGLAQGMREDFIGNDQYNQEIFAQIYKLEELPIWEEIDDFMKSEYYYEWDKYKAEWSRNK